MGFQPVEIWSLLVGFMDYISNMSATTDKWVVTARDNDKYRECERGT